MCFYLQIAIPRKLSKIDEMGERNLDFLKVNRIATVNRWSGFYIHVHFAAIS